jgi:hypothetical protein
MNYFDKVHKAYPEIHNYENAVIENKYFSSCGMNDEGKNIYELLYTIFLKLKMKIAFLTPEYPHPLLVIQG